MERWRRQLEEKTRRRPFQEMKPPSKTGGLARSVNKTNQLERIKQQLVSFLLFRLFSFFFSFSRSFV